MERQFEDNLVSANLFVKYCVYVHVVACAKRYASVSLKIEHARYLYHTADTYTRVSTIPFYSTPFNSIPFYSTPIHFYEYFNTQSGMSRDLFSTHYRTNCNVRSYTPNQSLYDE